MKNKRAVAFLALAMSLSIVLFPAGKVYATEGSVSGNLKDSTQPVAGEVIEEETVTTSESKNPEDMTREELIEFTKEQMKSDGTTSCDFYVGDDYVSIVVSFGDIGEFLELARNNNAYKESWDVVVDGMSDVTDLYYGYYKKYGMDVHLYVVEETDHDKVLIYSCNGQKIYDRVNDGDEDIKPITGQ